MNFLIADTFTAALARLPAAEAKATKTTAFDLQIDPSAPGMNLHRIDRSKDPNFWSVRVNADLRLIIHRTPASLLIAYVDHHDRAYAWAERRRIEAHPTTGAIQIVEVRERVDEVPAPPAARAVEPAAPRPSPPLFSALDSAALLSVGVPIDWLADVQSATEDNFLDLAQHLPAEAAEALLQYSDSGRLPVPGPVDAPDAYTHPDAQRRIRVIADQEELALALDYPWERWGVFLHPSQRVVVERSFNGPARVAGSAGTGKTVVALHRAVRLARVGAGRVLLTTFSEPLARALSDKLRVLAPEAGGIVPRITVGDWSQVAQELYQLAFGARPRLVQSAALAAMLAQAATDAGVRGFTSRFLESEWTNVIDPWGIDSLERYASVPRLGRRTPLGPRQRERLWSVFGPVAERLLGEGLRTQPGLCRAVAAHYSSTKPTPFAHVIVDESQDLGPAQLTMLRAIGGDGPDALFFAGDLGQRIFQHPFSWGSLGVDVRGRSSTLKVCYRTSRQIRVVADRLLPVSLRDPDGVEDVRGGTLSVFEGPLPEVEVFALNDEEIAATAQFLRAAIADGIVAAEIGIFVRTPALAARAHAATKLAGAGAATIALMHLAKGLEFRAVAVMACDEDMLPLDSRVATAADEGELDDIVETERQLFYVACTRARERLKITGRAPGSMYLQDIKSFCEV